MAYPFARSRTISVTASAWITSAFSHSEPSGVGWRRVTRSTTRVITGATKGLTVLAGEAGTTTGTVVDLFGVTRVTDCALAGPAKTTSTAATVKEAAEIL